MGISWRQFELPVKRLNAELCGWQLHFAERPWSSPSLSLSVSVLDDEGMRLTQAKGGCRE